MVGRKPTREKDSRIGATAGPIESRAGFEDPLRKPRCLGDLQKLGNAPGCLERSSQDPICYHYDTCREEAFKTDACFKQEYGKHEDCQSVCPNHEECRSFCEYDLRIEWNRQIREERSLEYEEEQALGQEEEPVLEYEEEQALDYEEEQVLEYEEEQVLEYEEEQAPEHEGEPVLEYQEDQALEYDEEQVLEYEEEQVLEREEEPVLKYEKEQALEYEEEHARDYDEEQAPGYEEEQALEYEGDQALGYEEDEALWPEEDRVPNREELEDQKQVTDPVSSTSAFRGTTRHTRPSLEDAMSSFRGSVVSPSVWNDRLLRRRAIGLLKDHPSIIVVALVALAAGLFWMQSHRIAELEANLEIYESPETPRMKELTASRREGSGAWTSNHQIPSEASALQEQNQALVIKNRELSKQIGIIRQETGRRIAELTEERNAIRAKLEEAEGALASPLLHDETFTLRAGMTRVFGKYGLDLGYIDIGSTTEVQVIFDNRTTTMREGEVLTAQADGKTCRLVLDRYGSTSGGRAATFSFAVYDR